MKRKSNLLKFCTILVLPFMLTLSCPLKASELSRAVDAITTKITYKSVKKAIVGQRIPIQAEIVDESGVDVARVYFRAADVRSYAYVTLNQSGDVFTGLLPAPAADAGEIDYLILVKNKSSQIVKSQNFHLPVVEADDDEVASYNETIEVYTEALEAPSTLEGFIDNIAINLAKSSAKYGVTAGIYSVAEAGSSSSSAVSAGTVTAASSGGISTTTIVVAGVGAVAVVGGAVAVTNSSDDDSGSAGGGNGGALTVGMIVGTWNVVGNDPGGATIWTAVATFNEDGTVVFNEEGSIETCSWSISGSNVTIQCSDDGGTSDSASSTRMVFNGPDGPTIFTR